MKLLLQAVGLFGICLIIFAPIAKSQEMGFVALSQGSANYEHLEDNQKATSSFFLDNAFKEKVPSS